MHRIRYFRFLVTFSSWKSAGKDAISYIVSCILILTCPYSLTVSSPTIPRSKSPDNNFRTMSLGRWNHTSRWESWGKRKLKLEYQSYINDIQVWSTKHIVREKDGTNLRYLCNILPRIDLLNRQLTILLQKIQKKGKGQNIERKWLKCNTK